MEIFRTVQEMVMHREASKTLGLVPTMGALHEGHLSLIHQSLKENEKTVVSIFVNPLQFNNAEDLEKYPITLEDDIALLKSVGVDILFLPQSSDLYPPSFSTSIDVGHIADKLEGPSRPGHFSGVATVVLKLINIVQPKRIYFGRKDAQQCAVIEQMIRDLNIDIDMICLPIWRGKTGLAYSSRNKRLSSFQRDQASAIFRGLERAHQCLKDGEKRPSYLREEIIKTLHEADLNNIDYVAFVDPVTFEDVSVIGDKVLALIAVYVGEVRLIDNMLLSAS